MPGKMSYEEQVQRFNAMMSLALSNAPAPLKLNNIEIRLLSSHLSLQGSVMKIPEHEHPNYELSFMNIGEMTTWIDESQVKCAADNRLIFFVPPLTLHHRRFGDGRININQSMVLTITGLDDKGKLSCVKLSELIETKKYSFRLTQELESLQKEIEKQISLNQSLAPVIIMHLVYAFISVFFQQNFPELFNASHQEHIILKADRLDAIKKMILNLMNRKEPLSLFEQHFNLSARHLNRIFKKETGLSIKKYQALQKLEQAKELLAGSTISIAEISHSLGFRDQVRFSVFFKKHQGCSPTDFRNSKDNPNHM